MFTLDCFTGGIAQTNGWVLALKDARILIDAPEGAADWLKEQKVSIDALVLTHQHFDHCIDAARIADEHDCPILAWSAFSRSLTLERLFGAVIGTQIHVPEFEVTQVLEAQTSLKLAGVEWQLFHVPGHSPDSVCLYESELGILFGGDVLLQGGIGRTDFPGGSMETLLEGIERDFLPLPDETRLFAGHGPDTTIGRERLRNPYLNG